MAYPNEQDGLTQAAGAVQNANKLAKILAAAGKGGIHAAAAQAVKEYKKGFIIAAVVVLSLPILMLVMLPTVIFGSLMSPPATVGSTILNDDAAVAQNIIEIRNRIGSILQEGYEDTLDDISTARASQTYTDLVDPVGGQVSYDAFTILCMYCAHMGAEDYTSISINDLAQQVQAHQDQFYSYTTGTEVRTDTEEVETENGTTEVEVDHTYTIYIVSYVGDSYFSDTIWQLTDEEKAFASAYAANLASYLYDLKEIANSSLLEELAEYYRNNPTGRPMPSGAFGDPLPDPDWRSHISSLFGRRADVGIPGHDTTNHKGLDIAMPYGTPILAVQSGVVVTAKWDNSYGNYVVIDHGGGISTLYAHCSKLLVSTGDMVEQYDTIAEVGSTGDSTGNHLHIGFIVDGQFQDPLNYLP